MIGRLREVTRQWLICKDQEWQVRLIGVAYIVGLTKVCPSADETISSYVGRAAIDARPWALVAERLIDRLLVLLGEEPGHCRRNVETAFLNLPPTA